ncbi:MAG TPA: AMP-binding protein, partial [Burkholderiaceae bacterium]
MNDVLASAATTSSRPWLTQYPPGVPGTVAVDTYASLVPLLEESWTRHARRDAAACMGVRFSYGDIDERSRALGAWLQSKGVRRGDRVAIMMPNVPQ